MSRKPKSTKVKPSTQVKRTTAVGPVTSPPSLTSFQAYQLAEQHFKTGQWHEAIALCRKILEVAPKYADALHLLGIIAAHTGSLEDAEQWMLKALEYSPNTTHYHNSLANIYRLLNQPELAAKHWQRAKGAGYPTWVKNFDTLTPDTIEQMRQALPHWQSPPLISVLMPTYNTKEEWLRAAIESVINQIYPHWELCIADDASTLPHVRQVLEEYAQRDSRLKVDYRQANGHISAASNSALALAQGDYIALLDHDDLLPPHALYVVAGEIMTHPQVRLLYSDEDKINERGERFSPYFKCDWNPDLFLSHNLITHLGVYKTVLVRELGGFREGYEGAQDYDLALRVVEHLKPHHIRHIPHVLYHWRTHSQSTALTPDAKPYAITAAKKAVGEHLARSGKTATQVTESFHCPGTLRVRYLLPNSPPLVSLIIPTRNRLDLLRVCIGSILEKTTYHPIEILIVDNNSDDPATLSYLQGLPQTSSLPIRVISYPQPFNYAALNNFAVAQAQGELIGLLNNDIEVINDGWLTEMVSHACRPEIGAVGARLWYPNNTLQHGGIILGIGGVAGHSHKHLPRGDSGYFGRAQLLQNFSAVTAACLVMRKEVFTAVGGFNDTDLTIAFNDVDLCLRIREQGWRILWTPYAELYHHESASRGYEDTPEKQTRFAAEIKYMKTRWGESLLKDPAYSPNLSLDTEDFAMTWPPRVQFNETLKHYFQQLRASLPAFLKFRQTGYQLLTGHGLEIGALMWPAQVPHRCLVDYCDAQSKSDSLKLFPEIEQLNLVEVDYICDLDQQWLSSFQAEQFDFVILNQVIEHLANPIQVITELFRVTKVGGQVVIAAPDKNFTFDKSRALTSFEHLRSEYENQVQEVTDDHYLDFLLHVHPELELATASSAEVEKHLHNVRTRREHVHVWDSQTFKAFLVKTLELLNIQADCIFEVTGEENQFESFSVWQKKTTQPSPSYYKALARVLEVSKPNSGHSALWGFAIDSPLRGMAVSVSSLKITGWVLGREAAVLVVEIAEDTLTPSCELLFKTTVLNEIRPDVAKVFPEVPQAKNSGFSVEINLPNSFQNIVVKVTALLANQQRIKLAGIKLQRFLVPLSFQPRPDSADKIVNNPNYAGWYNTIHRFLSESFIPQLTVDTPIDIIIPIYNGYDYLTTLLPSVLKNTRLPHRIILFDDASPDPKVVRYLEELRDTYDHIVLIRAAHNLGFVGAVNTAYQQVNNHFVILNQDTEVPEYWLERLMYPIIKYHDVASTTPFTNSGTICSFPTFLEDNPLFKGLTVDQLDNFFNGSILPTIMLKFPREWVFAWALINRWQVSLVCLTRKLSGVVMGKKMTGA